MKVIFFGTPHFVVPILEKLLQTHEVLAIVTTPDQKVGRKQILTPSPVKAAYQKYLNETTHEIQHPPHIFMPEDFSTLHSQLSNLKPDLFVVAAYGKIIPQQLIDIPVFGSINVHPSLLPKYRGPSPIQQALYDGEKVTGVTVIKMDAEMDHGPILAAEPYEIHPTDTFETLANHLFGKAAEILPSVIKAYTSGTMQPLPQDHQQATFTKRITKYNGYFDIGNPPTKEQLARMIRAYYPWPTVWTRVLISGKEKLLKFLPGDKLQLEGKNPMSVKDFLNGYPEFKEKISSLLL